MAMLEPDEQVIILASPRRNLKCIQNDFSQGQLEPAGDLSRCAVADRRVLLRYGLGLLSFPLMQKLAPASGDEVEKQSNDGYSRLASRRTQLALYAFPPDAQSRRAGRDDRRSAAVDRAKVAEQLDAILRQIGPATLMCKTPQS